MSNETDGSHTSPTSSSLGMTAPLPANVSHRLDTGHACTRDTEREREAGGRGIHRDWRKGNIHRSWRNWHTQRLEGLEERKFTQKLEEMAYTEVGGKDINTEVGGEGIHRGWRKGIHIGWMK